MRRIRKTPKSLNALKIVAATPLLFLVAFVFSLLATSTGQKVLGALLLAFLCLAASVVIILITRSRRKREIAKSIQISDIDSMPGHHFEHYIATLLEARGFRATVTRGSGDSGVDIVARGDGVSYAIQCKRSASKISRRAISDAVAGIAHYKCTDAMVVTNQHFTPGAKSLAASNNCILVDRDTLSIWIHEWQKGRLLHDRNDA